MEAIQIENPIETVNFDKKWQTIREHVLHVIGSTPEECSLIKDNEARNELLILLTPLDIEFKVVGHDQILSIMKINEISNTTDVKFEISNENNHISAFSELEKDKKAMNAMIILIKKSIAGTFDQSLKSWKDENNSRAQKDATIGVIKLVVAIGLTITAIYGFVQSCNLP